MGVMCCASSALCCAGQMCCNCLCSSCNSCGVPSKNFSRVGYVFFQIIWIAFSLLIMFSAKDLLDWFPDYMLECPDASGSGSVCLGASNIIRMSFVLFCFHLFVFLFILSRNAIAAGFHDGCWGTKFIIVAVCWIASMWIPNSFIMTYLQISRYASALFLIYQSLLMLIVAFKVNDQLISNYENDEGNCSGIILLGVTFGITAGNIWWIIKMFMTFSCTYNIIIMSVTCLAVIAMYALNLLGTRKDASICTTAVAALYILYLQWTALSSDDDKVCNGNFGQESNTVWQIVAGLAFTFVALSIISASSTSGEDKPADDIGGHMMEKKEDLQDRPDEETGRVQ